MKICCISDTHGKHNLLTKDIPPNCDVIIHSGDISSMGYEYEVEQFLNWFSKLDSPLKIFIAGNHDWLFDSYRLLAKELLSNYPDIIYLENSEVVINGIKFYGSPQQPRFLDWAFNIDRGEKIRQYWKMIPKNTDILITHGPPYGYGDAVNMSELVGCEDLREIVDKIEPIYHIFGHVHPGYGVYKTNKTTFINASNLDEKYNYCNKPITFELNTDFII